MTLERRDEIAQNLAAVRERIAAACVAAARSPEEVTLIAVTKTYPATDVVHLAALGVTEVGENRDQEAAAKAVEVARLLDLQTPVAAADVAVVGRQPRWHFVGQLQRNKCRSVVTYADVVHSVDSVRLAEALGQAAARREDRPVEVLVQLSVDGDPHRGGALMAGDDVDREMDRVAAAIAAQPALRLRGVMAVAPLDWAPEAAFAEVARCAALIRSEHPDATVISAGMSADLDAAIGYGATHVRIGSALLGKRPPLR